MESSSRRTPFVPDAWNPRRTPQSFSVIKRDEASIIRRDEASITRIRRKRLSAAPDYPGKNSFSSCFVEISIEKDGESFSSSPKDPRKKSFFVIL